MSVRLAIIGGTGVYDANALTDLRTEEVKTPYGDVKVKIGTYNGEEVAFLARHGSDHSVPPHLVNYRANIWALRVLGVERVIATTAVGSVNPDVKPGHFMLPHTFLDFTKSRPSTYFEGGEAGVVHVDVTDPYCPTCREALARAAREVGVTLHTEGTYACFEGPRFETTGETRMVRMLGADIVGMTQCPEVVLARELGLCYATVSMVANYAPGVEGVQSITADEVVTFMAANAEAFRKLTMLSLTYLPSARTCTCSVTADKMKV